jgi:hypothetical protein
MGGGGDRRGATHMGEGRADRAGMARGARTARTAGRPLGGGTRRGRGIAVKVREGRERRGPHERENGVTLGAKMVEAHRCHTRFWKAN